jgi:anti-anti-sigma factor
LLVVGARAATRGAVTEDRDAIVWLSGEHDCSTDGALCHNLAKAISLDQPTVVVDLSQVVFIGASTIRLLMLASDYLRQRSQSLMVRSPSRQACRALALCDPAHILSLRSSAYPEGVAPTPGAPGVARNEREAPTMDDGGAFASGVEPEPSVLLLAG